MEFWHFDCNRIKFSIYCKFGNFCENLFLRIVFKDMNHIKKFVTRACFTYISKQQSDFTILCGFYFRENITLVKISESTVIVFVLFDSLRPINDLSVKQGLVFLGLTSIKLG